MGRLIGLELHNFKSYKGTTQIGFGTSCFTSIIGPNGAGKSNMMDAISFVLGIKSSHLRSQNMKDLVYRGRLEDTELKDASLDVIDQNPTTAHVKAVYEKDDGEKLEFKRTILSNGNTDYKINETAVTAAQYFIILKNENILIKAKNFLVFQGDVESIASQTPKDLTRLIETISGSIELSKEFDELKDEVDKSHEFSNSVFARKRNLNSESRQYKEQLVEQELFEKKLIEKSNLIKTINLYKLFHNESKHDEMKDLLNSKMRELKTLKGSLKSEEKNYGNLITEYSSKSLEFSKFTDKIKNLQTSMDEKRNELIPISANQKSLLNKTNNHKLKIKDLSREISKKEDTISTLEQQLNAVKKEFKKFEDKINKGISSSDLSPEVHKEYEELRNRYLANGGSELEEQLSLLTNEKHSIETMIKIREEQIEDLDNIITELEFNMNSELNLNLSSINSEISEILATKNDKVSLKNEMIKKLEQSNYKELKLNSELRDILVKLDDMTSRQRESNKFRKKRETLSLLKNVLPKGTVKGFVYELLQPSHKRYESALITLLGKNIDSIIVETTAVAYRCIEILKERRLGVATFIPLDSISSGPINLNYLRSLHPNAQPGVDIVDIEDSSLENAVNYVIGNALVADDLAIARELKWGPKRLDLKLVTLQGSIINRSGLMTGGINTERIDNLSWDNKEVKALTEIKNDLTQELAKINDEKPKEIEINLINDSITDLEDKLPLLRNKKEVIERSMKDKITEIDFNKDAIVSSKELIESKKKEMKKVDLKIQVLVKEAGEIQQGIFADFCKKHKFRGGIQDYEELHGASLRSKSRERAQFNKIIMTLSNRMQFEFEALEETKARKDNLENQLKSMEAKTQSITDQKDDIESDLCDLEAEYEVLNEEKTKSSEELKEKLKYTNHIEANIKDYKSEIDNLYQSITNTEEILLKVDIERVNILKNCKIQNIIIPLVDGLLEQISLNESVDMIAKKIYEIEIDYSMLNDRLRDNFNAKMEAELDARLNQVIEELVNLTPNTKASERLKETENRLRNFDRDFTMARQRENKAAEKFSKIKGKRQEMFMKAFEHISGKIDDIYKELTKTFASPMGGSAYLTLESDDEPYLHGIKYHAMPPMKRFRDMELLSGGEKTMAALALLFAIHSFHPSPFFVLDEVDAALDSANVNKIANYIKKISSPTFQFIVISLKNALFEKSDALVGIYREQRENSSRTITLDLRDYPDDEAPIVGAAA
ncbi:Structural maintenance of chromosomes protein 1 [Yamadazyma tenuis]|uniref:Structural maintenance of chromosomes protein 1 n=1 Tax=Candida tenuis TaxID=2315449 RepID=UPI0027A18805|nr:Structural maintenance of chromosomes protein 1 [Yamadazyma tenuis]